MITIGPDEFNNLKSRVKAEMIRRKHEGSVEHYGSEKYDYDEIPTELKVIKSEHGSKIVDPIRAINPSGMPSEINEGSIVENLEIVDTQLTILEAIDLTSTTNTGCAASCTGLCSTSCSGTCTDACTGCTSCTGCSGTCENECTSCTGTCSGGCSTSCSGGCKNSCYDDCTSCTDACTDICGFSCTSCTGTCAACGSGCSSCSGCSGSCTGECTAGCLVPALTTT